MDSPSFCVQEPLPDWLGGAADPPLLQSLARGESVDVEGYLQALGQPGGFVPVERGVLGLVLPSSDPAIPDFSSFFEQLPRWAQGDGSPVDGDERAHRERVRLAFWSLVLGEAHDIALPFSWGRQAGAAARYLLCRFSGYRHLLGAEWTGWASLANHLDPSLLEGLAIGVAEEDETWRGFRRFRPKNSERNRWKAVAFREAGLCVLTGAGAVAVGAAWGCELSVGNGPLAVVSRSQGQAWRLESARSAPDQAGFRLLSGADERLMVKGRHGRILVISERMDTTHQVNVEVSARLQDRGPRRLGDEGNQLELDRSAAWASTAQLWTGRKAGNSAPVRLRVALSAGG